MRDRDIVSGVDQAAFMPLTSLIEDCAATTPSRPALATLASLDIFFFPFAIRSVV